MKEFIEKLLCRLEINSFPLTFNFETEKYLKFDKAKEIVNQLAEEYNNDVCEWKEDEKFNWFFKSPHEGVGIVKEESGLFNFCPYCGKKIKVVE